MVRYDSPYANGAVTRSREFITHFRYADTGTYGYSRRRYNSPYANSALTRSEPNRQSGLHRRCRGAHDAFDMLVRACGV
jgi:hypothetical protein